jgi:CxxC motif-containing protein (DUF1111 family)
MAGMYHLKILQALVLSMVIHAAGVYAVTYTFVHINFFTQDVAETGTDAVFKYFPFKTQDADAAISGVKLNYILNNGPVFTVQLSKTGDCYTAYVPASPGSVIDYYYTLECKPLSGSGIITDDTKWFRKTMGTLFDPAPDFPLFVESSGRFRGRHENEYRSDMFPGTDYKNTVYNLVFKDYGDSLEMAVFPSVNSTQLELHAFNHYAVDTVCSRAGYALNMGSTTNFLVKQHTGPAEHYPQGSPFGAGIPWYTTTVAAVSNGELVEFELLLTEAGTGTVLTSVTYRYYIGAGKLGQRFQHPWANVAGSASISSVTETQFCFTQHCTNTLPGRTLDFLTGKVLFDTDWKTGFLRKAKPSPDCNGGVTGPGNEKSPLYTTGALGPLFLQASCCECHVQAGAGHAADSAGDSLQAMVFLGVAGPAGTAPHPAYGDILRSKTVDGAPPDGRIQVLYSKTGGTFDDGTPFILRKPVVHIDYLAKGPLGSAAEISYRISPFLCGTGLLEAVPDSTILSNADSNDADRDGISGRPNFATDPIDGKMRTGRFGFKASMPSLKGEIAFVASRCMGLSNQFYPDSASPATLELPDSSINQLLSYVAFLVPPPRKNWKDPSAIRGKFLFEEAGCVKCHIPAMRTGVIHQFAELRGLEIQPFTDLLLHDMGPGLADSLGQGIAQGPEWRTAPLWGIGYIAEADGRESYLHDGRAQSILEAVLWHGGEAEKTKKTVMEFSASQRADLVAYCKYPFADRLPMAPGTPVVSPKGMSAFSRQALMCSPNPVRSYARFRLENASIPAHDITASIFNLKGRRLDRLTILPGNRDFVWDARWREAGTYIAVLSVNGMVYRREFLVMR